MLPSTRPLPLDANRSAPELTPGRDGRASATTPSSARPSALAYPYAKPPAPGTTVAIAPRMLWLRMPLPFALDHINLWLLDDGDTGYTLVDCGYGDQATRSLWERHFVTTLAGRPIRQMIATHCHPDHVGNAAWLEARFGVPIAMTHAEFLTAHAIANERGAYATDETVSLFRRHGMSEADLAALRGYGNRYRHGVPELPRTFDRLVDGDVRAGGGTAWTIVEGHGHSPEHASLHSAERGVLISGDMLLPTISTNVAVYAVEPDGDPLGRFLDSLAAFARLPADTLVLPSHGLPFRGIGPRVAELRAHHDARLAEVLQAARQTPSPIGAADVVPVLFRRELDVHQRFFAMGEAIAHLNFLWHRATLERRVAADGSIRFAAPAR